MCQPPAHANLRRCGHKHTHTFAQVKYQINLIKYQSLITSWKSSDNHNTNNPIRWMDKDKLTNDGNEGEMWPSHHSANIFRSNCTSHECTMYIPKWYLRNQLNFSLRCDAMRFGEQIFIVASFNFRWRNNRYINMRTSMRNFCTLTLRSGCRIPISLWIWYQWCSLRLHACLFIYFWINQTVLHQFFIICICANFCPRDWQTRCDDALEFNRKCHQARELRYTDRIASHRTIQTNFYET